MKRDVFYVRHLDIGKRYKFITKEVNLIDRVLFYNNKNI